MFRQTQAPITFFKQGCIRVAAASAEELSLVKLVLQAGSIKLSCMVVTTVDGRSSGVRFSVRVVHLAMTFALLYLWSGQLSLDSSHGVFGAVEKKTYLDQEPSVGHWPAKSIIEKPRSEALPPS